MPLRKAVSGKLTVSLCAVALAVAGGAGLRAQESPNPLFQFTFGQFLEVSDNPNLEVSPEGTSVIADTNIALAFESATRVSQLAFALAGGFEAGTFDEDEFDTRLSERTANLSYARATRPSALALDVSYRLADMDDILLTDEFEEEDLIITDGQRERLGFGAVLELGREAPVGFNLAAQYRETDYINVPVEEATPRADTSLSAAVNLAVARNAQIGLTASASRSEYDNESDYVSERRSLGLAATYAVSPELSLSAQLSGSRVETTESGQTEEIEGLTGSFGIALDRPNGEVAISVGSSLNSTGRRSLFRFSRSYALRRGGDLAFSVGATDSEDTDPSALVSLAYDQELPRGDFTIGLSQEAVNSEDDEEAIRSRLALSWEHAISEISSLNASFSLADFNVLTGGGEDTRRTDATLAWQRALTRNLSLRAGYTHSFADSDSNSSRSSNTVFIGVQGGVSLLP